MNQSPRLILCGAARDTGNLGVSALSTAIIQSLQRRIGDADLTVLDHSEGVAPETIGLNGSTVALTRAGAHHTRRVWRPESWWRIGVEARLSMSISATVRRILHADAILDISGGDSFTDLYGVWRFKAVTMPKLIALENDIPLILLPQTYGPFESPRHRRKAERIVRGAAMAWARDARSFATLRDLAGDAFDPDRHRQGVDVAFLLEPRRPDQLDGQLEAALDAPHDRPLVGLNVSGLLYHDPERARSKFGFVADYRAIVHGFVRRLLDETDATILLVPHVLTPAGHYESDPDANDAVAREFAGRDDRLIVTPPNYDECGMKWIISQCDWFCGTRMHSTIAALSSSVPAAAIAYSVKTRGVFDTVGLGDEVADPREAPTEAVVDALWRSWRRRDATRATLAAHLPDALRIANEQMDAIASRIAQLAEARKGAERAAALAAT